MFVWRAIENRGAAGNPAQSFQQGVIMNPKDSQFEKFREAAREAECDTSEERFNKALKKVADSATVPQKQGGASDATGSRETDSRDEAG